MPCASPRQFNGFVLVAVPVVALTVVGTCVGVARHRRKYGGDDGDSSWQQWRGIRQVVRFVKYIWASRLDIKVSVKLIVSFFQIATKVPTVYQVRMPAPVQGVVKAFNFVSLDLDAFGLPWHCLGIDSFFNRLLVMASLPLVLMLVVFIISLILSVCARGRTRVHEKALTVDDRGLCRATFLRALPGVGLISFFAFPVVSSYAFRAFDCECFDDGRSYLRADYSLLCSTGCEMPSRPMLVETAETGTYTDEYWEVQYLARAAIAFYPVGIPLLYLILLLCARKALGLETAPKTAFSKALGFLHREYEPRFFWWEILDVTKKLVLVGFAAIIVPGTVYQLVMAMIFSLTLMLLIRRRAVPLRRSRLSGARLVLLPLRRLLLVGRPQDRVAHALARGQGPAARDRSSVRL